MGKDEQIEQLQNNIKWLTTKYGQMALQAEALMEQVQTLKEENSKLKQAKKEADITVSKDD